MKSILGFSSYILLAGALIGMGCNKVNNDLYIPEEVAHFTNMTSASYQVTAPGVTYKVPIGLTSIPKSDVTVNVEVYSPTGAVQGTQYSLSGTSVTIRAGQVLDSLEVSGVYDEYIGGRKDTLVFVIKQPQRESGYNDTFKLAMRGPCFEGDVVLSELEAGYNNTFDGSYGPYQTIITSTISTGLTTATITIRNFWDAGFVDLQFDLDWTDPVNRKVTVEPQFTGQNGSVKGGAAYAAYDLWIYPVPNQVGTFSACNQTFTIRYRMCLPELGGCFAAESTIIGR